MMLERIERIAKTGLFEDHTHAPGCEFGAVTLVYGENGVGKSTLAAVLDSLRERNASEIIRRRSLPGDVAPTVIVRLARKLRAIWSGWKSSALIASRIRASVSGLT